MGVDVSRRAAWAAMVYLLVAVSWILLTSLALGAMELGPEAQTWAEVLKGFVFVVASAIVIFLIVRRALSRVLEERSARAKTQRELAEALHRSSAAVLAASVAHDLNNVLLTLFIEIEDLTGDAAQVERMSKALRRAAELSRGLMQAGAPSGAGEAGRFDAAAVVREALDAARRHQAVRSCEVEVELPDHAPLHGFGRLLHRVVINLVINAADAHADGRILVRLLPDGQATRLEVHDDGPGFPPEVRSRLLEPFFTTKKTGTGLGLLSVRLCAELHSGWVEFGESPELGGARVQLALGPASPSVLPPALVR